MILIVDDDVAIRESLCFLLSCEGLESRSFATGQQLLDSCTVTDRDFLITDVHLPGMNGIDLLKTMRSRGLRLPVVLMTGQPSSTLRQRANEIGATAFLEKPLRDAEILSLIRQSEAPSP